MVRLTTDLGFISWRRVCVWWGLLRIPTKPAMHSELMPATYSNFIPAGVPI
jgi:hypothetical protein